MLAVMGSDIGRDSPGEGEGDSGAEFVADPELVRHRVGGDRLSFANR